MAYIEVEVDIIEFETHELVSELCNRINSHNKNKKLTEKQKKELLDELMPLVEEFEIETDKKLPKDRLVDTMKYDHIVEVFNKYSLEEFERLIPLK